MLKTKDLKDEISRLKSELMKASKKNEGLNADKVLEKSQELDKLIVAYMGKEGKN